MAELIKTVLTFGSGYRTYMVAAGLIINTFTPLFSGDMSLGEIDVRGLLEGLGLASLRAGISNK